MKIDTSDTRVGAETLRGYASHFLESVTIGGQGDVLKSDSPNEKGFKKLSSRGCSAPICPWVSPPGATVSQMYEKFRDHKAEDHQNIDAFYLYPVYLYVSQPLGPEGNLPSQPEGGAKETERS